MYANDCKCMEHDVFATKLENVEKNIDVIHSDLKSIKWLLVTIVASILGVGAIC